MPTFNLTTPVVNQSYTLTGGGVITFSDPLPVGHYQVAPYVPPADVWGADFSKWNGVVDFNQVVAAGYQRLIHRATMGATGVDEMVLQNFPKMVAAQPKKLGLYHLFIKGVPGAAQFQNIKTMLDQLGPQTNYPLTIDVEPLRADVFTDVHAEVWTPLVDLLNLLTPYLGYNPVIYTAEWAVERMGLVNANFLLNYPLHFAHYTQGTPFLPNPWRDAHKPWFAWQCDNGEMPWSVKVPGSAKTDRSRYSVNS